MMTNKELQTAINSLMTQIQERWSQSDLETISLLRKQLEILFTEQIKRCQGGWMP